MSMLRTTTGSANVNSFNELIFDLPSTGTHALVIFDRNGTPIYDLRNIPGKDVARGTVKTINQFLPGEHKIVVYDQNNQPISALDIRYQQGSPRVSPSVIPPARQPSPPRAGPSTMISSPSVARPPSPARTPVYSTQVPKTGCGCSLKNRA